MPQEMQTTAWLETERGDKIPLQGLCSIGRGESNHIILNTSAMSRHHAVIHERDKEFWMVDLGSVNGVQVNGRRVVQPVRLQTADEIVLPSARFIFRQGTELVTLPAQSPDRIAPEPAPTPELVVAESQVTQLLPKVSAGKAPSTPPVIESPKDLPVLAEPVKEKSEMPKAETPAQVSISPPKEEIREVPPLLVKPSSPPDEEKSVSPTTAGTVVTEVPPSDEKKPSSSVTREPAGEKRLRGRKKRRAAWKEKMAASLSDEKAAEAKIEAVPLVEPPAEKRELPPVPVAVAPLVETVEVKKEPPQAIKSGSLIETPEETGAPEQSRAVKPPRVYVVPSEEKGPPLASGPPPLPLSEKLVVPPTTPLVMPVVLHKGEEKDLSSVVAPVTSTTPVTVEVKKISPEQEAAPSPAQSVAPVSASNPVPETKNVAEGTKREEKKGPPYATVTKLSIVAVKPDEKMEALLAAGTKAGALLKKGDIKEAPAAAKPDLLLLPAPPKAEKSEPAQEGVPKVEPPVTKSNEQKELALASAVPAVKPEEGKATPPALVPSTELTPAPVEKKKEELPVITAKTPPPLEEKKEVIAVVPAPSSVVPPALAQVTVPAKEIGGAADKPGEKQESKAKPDEFKTTSDRAKPAKVCVMAQQSMYIGLTSIFLPFIGVITAVLAIVLGHKALRLIKQSKGELAGRESAVMGLYFGYITMGIIVVYSTFFYFIYATPSSPELVSNPQEIIPLNMGVPPKARQGLAPSMLTPGGQKAAASPPPVQVLTQPNPLAPPPTGVIPSSQSTLTVLSPDTPTKSPDTMSQPAPAVVPTAPEPSNEVAMEKAPTTVPPVGTQVDSSGKTDSPPPSEGPEKPAAADTTPIVFSYDQQLKLKDQMLALPMPNDSVDSTSYMDAEAFNNSARILARKPEQKYADSVEDFLDGVKDRNPDQARLKILSKMFENYRAGLESQ